MGSVGGLLLLCAGQGSGVNRCPLLLCAGQGSGVSR